MCSADRLESINELSEHPDIKPKAESLGIVVVGNFRQP